MPSDPLQALRAKLSQGHDISLVLGAGVSLSRGIPSWGNLATVVCRGLGVALPADVLTRHPLALPIAFELAEHRAQRKRASASASFATVVREALYAGLKPGVRGDSIHVLSQFVRAQQAAARRCLRRVITFNADDLLERGTNGRQHPLRAPVVWPVARESSRPRMARGAGGRSPIPIYHVHGFLPRSGTPLARHEAADTMVFTEAQYWSSFAEPASFPNRVILGALHDSVCIFLGLSMTDLNLARWLGVRANAVQRDRERRSASTGRASRRQAVQTVLNHHFWVRRIPAAESAEAYVTPLLRRRGVRTIELADWSELGPLLSSLPAGH
jgi:hypothetical protein